MKVARGEALRVLGKDPDNPGWRWCENAEGLGGWLPEDLVRDGRAMDDFDTAELTVAVEEKVTLLNERAAWWLCRGETGQVGWVPARCLRRR